MKKGPCCRNKGLSEKIFLYLLPFFLAASQFSCGLAYVDNIQKNSPGPSSSPSSSSQSSSSNAESVSSAGDNQSAVSGDTASGTGQSSAADDTTAAGIYENAGFSDTDYTVTKVIDGDTIDLKNNMRLRLIGINTPEKDMYFYEEAKEFMEILVLGKQVKLEKDVTGNDMYGRYLRYVYLPGMFVNLEMVRSGFANAYTYPPDVKYTDIFLEAERSARAKGAGLWQKAPDEVLEVVLNYDADGPDTENLNGEWVSIKNTGEKPLNLKNWTLKDAGTNIYHFGSYQLAPGETVCLYTGIGTDTRGSLYWNSDMPIWNNEHDTLYIRDAGGLLVYLYNY